MPTINNKAVMACYVLEPEGLQFSIPVSVKITLPFSGNTTPMPLLFSEIHGVSLLDEVNVVPVKTGNTVTTVTIEGKISQFSDLIVNKQGPFSISLTPPSNALAGLPFDIRATLIVNPEFKNMVVKKKGKVNESIVTYWVAFISCRYDCILTEQGTVNHLSPHEVKIPGAEIKLQSIYSTQQIPFTVSFDADASSNAVVENCRLVMELTTQSRSDKLGSPIQKTIVFTPEISSTFAIKKPWVNGKYLVNTTVISDPSNYAHSIQLASALTCSIAVNGSVITIKGNGNWVTVRGNIEPDGHFFATGKGLVGISSDTGVELRGHFTGYMTFEAEYSMGGGGIRVIFKITGKNAATASGVQVSNSPLCFSGGFQSFIESAGWIRSSGMWAADITRSLMYRRFFPILAS